MADGEEWYESVGFEVVLWFVFVVLPAFSGAVTFGAVIFGKTKQYWRKFSMFCNVYMWIYITALVVWSLTELGDVLDKFELVFEIGIPVTYIFVLLESLGFSSEFQYIGNLADTTGTEGVLKRLRQSLGIITFHAKCYHWETRTRTVTERDSKGNTSTRTETYQVKVVTHTESETYDHSRQVDASPASIKYTTGPSHSVTRVKLSKNYELGDKLTAQDFHAKNEAFQDRNRGRDVHFDHRIDFSVPSFVEHITLTKDSSGAPFWIGKCWILVATLLGMSWPYRWLFRAATGRAEYTVAKKIFLQ